MPARAAGGPDSVANRDVLIDGAGHAHCIIGGDKNPFNSHRIWVDLRGFFGVCELNETAVFCGVLSLYKTAALPLC